MSIVENGPVKRKRRWALWLLGLFALLSFTVLVILQTSNLWKKFTVDSASDTLLLYALSSLNFIALVIFGFIFLRSIVKLWRERQASQVGSKIKTKLLVYFVAISILPIFAMAGFSYGFMNRALERWFSQIPENVVRAPLEIEGRANAERMTRLEETARLLAVSLEDRGVSERDLQRMLVAGNLSAIKLLSGTNVPLMSATSGLIGEGPESDAIRTGRFDAAELHDGHGIDAAVGQLSDGRKLFIASQPRAAENVSEMVDTTLAEFDTMKSQNVMVRQIGMLTLGVLTFLLIFASSWTALYIARGLTVPIRALAEGAEEIAKGKLGHRVDIPAEDELALLVSAFNEMSSKLEANSAELTERRRYIETVLLSLPTGVISVDSEDSVDTINPAARLILHLEPGKYRGSKLIDLLAEPDREAFARLIARAKRVGHASDQIKIRGTDADSERSKEGSPIAITASALPDIGGAVLVIEDLSELIAAQRASAWQEVARRMAHEIKNPLTPIQLSAERIAKRFTGSSEPALAGLSGPTAAVDADKARVVSDGTQTILREVQSLKSMVDEFSRFARLPDVKLESGDVNEVLRQTAALYVDRSDDATLNLILADALPPAMIDEEQMKRVFVNLIDNAIEVPGSDDSERMITILSRHDAARDLIIVEVSDNGSGVDPADYQKLFQPYFSTKGRGTGLGLPIVHRIVTDHFGKIKAVPNSPRGARFVVELPVSS